MELNRESTACFTGHRMIASEKRHAVETTAERVARALVMRGYDTFLCGGALGFDTLAQQAVLRLRQELPFLRVVMVCPCEDQDARWREEDRRIYRMLSQQADERIVLHPAYTDGCMLERNRFMIAHSSACVAYYNGNSFGGTAYTVRYAEQCGVRTYNLFGLRSGEY